MTSISVLSAINIYKPFYTLFLSVLRVRTQQRGRAGSAARGRAARLLPLPQTRGHSRDNEQEKGMTRQLAEFPDRSRRTKQRKTDTNK